MNEIMKVDFTSQTVSARDLYETLNISKRFSAWFEDNSQGFIEGQDFTSVLSGTVVNNGAFRELQDYQMSVDMAKHICLMSRTDKGKEVRQYLIDLEKAWNTPEQIMARALTVAQQIITDKDKLIETMKPKAAFFDAVSGSKTALSMDEVAKVLNMGFGRNKLFELLRNAHILNEHNVPYQKYVDNRWFRVIEQKYTKGDMVVVTTKTLVYQKGVDGIRKMFDKPKVGGS